MGRGRVREPKLDAMRNMGCVQKIRKVAKFLKQRQQWMPSRKGQRFIEDGILHGLTVREGGRIETWHRFVGPTPQLNSVQLVNVPSFGPCLLLQGTHLTLCPDRLPFSCKTNLQPWLRHHPEDGVPRSDAKEVAWSMPGEMEERMEALSVEYRRRNPLSGVESLQGGGRAAASPAPPPQVGSHSTQPCTGSQERTRPDAEVVWEMPEELRSIIAKRLATAEGSLLSMC